MPQTQFLKIESLRFTLAEWMSIIGVVGFLISLALPAIKHGQDQLGVNCFTMALFCVFGSSPSPLANERQIMSIASHAIHLSTLISLFLIWIREMNAFPIKAICAMATMTCVLYIRAVPYSNIEAVYFGFYLWLASMALIAIAQFLPNPATNAE